MFVLLGLYLDLFELSLFRVLTNLFLFQRDHQGLVNHLFILSKSIYTINMCFHPFPTFSSYVFICVFLSARHNPPFLLREKRKREILKSTNFSSSSINPSIYRFFHSLFFTLTRRHQVRSKIYHIFLRSEFYSIACLNKVNSRVFVCTNLLLCFTGVGKCIKLYCRSNCVVLFAKFNAGACVVLTCYCLETRILV